MVTLRKPMTEVEKQLFREAIIKEYKLKHPEKTKNQFGDILARRLKTLIPFQIIIGIAASAVLIYIEGWMSFVHLLLFGIIWATIISAIISILLKTK
jgi:hypothetical protein